MGWAWDRVTNRFPQGHLARNAGDLGGNNDKWFRLKTRSIWAILGGIFFWVGLSEGRPLGSTWQRAGRCYMAASDTLGRTTARCHSADILRKVLRMSGRVA